MMIELVITLIIFLMVIVYFASKKKNPENKQLKTNQNEYKDDTIEYYEKQKRDACYEIEKIIIGDTAEKYRVGNNIVIGETYVADELIKADHLIMKESKFAYNNTMRLYYTKNSIKQYEDLFEGRRYVYIKPKLGDDINEWHIYNKENKSNEYEGMMNIAIEMNGWLK